jgi:NhaP-type Na+/H+ or K+/H+ antiporter
MKIVLKILFFIFIGALIIGVYLKNNGHPKAEIILGVDIIFLTFILMPLFIYYRYRNGKYKKYILDPKSKNPFKIDKDKL